MGKIIGIIILLDYFQICKIWQEDFAIVKTKTELAICIDAPAHF